MLSRRVFIALCLALLALCVVNFASATESMMEISAQAEMEMDLAVQDDDEPTEPAGASSSRPNGLCDVCRYVIENKQRRQPYLCRGLKDVNYQKYCVRVMESMIWWVNNEVYWVNYGCERLNNGAQEWVRPCPASAICSWLQDFEIKDSFCPLDPMFPKPE